jgi:hypothetical protein
MYEYLQRTLALPASLMILCFQTGCEDYRYPIDSAVQSFFFDAKVVTKEYKILKFLWHKQDSYEYVNKEINVTSYILMPYVKKNFKSVLNCLIPYWAHISGSQTSGSNRRGSPPVLYNKCGGWTPGYTRGLASWDVCPVLNIL